RESFGGRPGGRAAPRGATVAKLNVRFLVMTLAAGAALAAGVHALHAYQTRRGAPAPPAVADRGEAEGDGRGGPPRRPRAPGPGAAAPRHALLFAALARTPEERLQAYLALGQTLRRSPGRDDVRRRAVDLALHPSLRRHAEAEEHLRALVRSSPGDAGLE